jgi:AraC-like DNA-binding protein
MKSSITEVATGVQKFYGGRLEFDTSGRDLKAYALVHLVEGDGYYWDVDLGKVRIEKNQVMVLFPGLVHRYGCEFPRDRWIEQFVVFDGPVFQALEGEGWLNRKNPVISLQGDPKWGGDFYRYINEQRGGKGMLQPEKSVAELHMLLARLLKQSSVESSWVEMAVEKLGQKLSCELEIETVATDFGMSEQTFRKRFKQETGYSPHQFRLIRRLEWARDHLLKGRDKLEVLAIKCGFCDHYHFSRQFKKAFGLSPGAYRKSQGVHFRNRDLQKNHQS